MADQEVTRQAHRVAEQKIRSALRSFSATELFPEHAMLVPDDPRARVELGFCDLRIGLRGVAARISITPMYTDRPHDWVLPAVFQRGIALPTLSSPTATDVTLELSLDVVNLLLDAWARSGLLARLVGADRLIEDANELLSEYTTLQILSLRNRLPPILTALPPTSHTASWAVGLGGVTLEIDDQRSYETRFAVSGGRGQLGLQYFEERGSLKLTGQVEGLHVVCERPESRDDWVTLSSCFSSALDLDSLADDWSRRLGPESDLIPELRLRDLIARKTSGVFRGGLQIDDVVVEAPREAPGLVRLQASVGVPRAQTKTRQRPPY